MKNLLKTTVCFTTMSLTAILLPMNVMANEGEDQNNHHSLD